MTSERGELAAARGAAAALRAEQLRNRIARLRAGEASTPADLVLARVSADQQRAEVVRAQERLMRTYARSAQLRRAWTGGERSPVPTPAPVGRADVPVTGESAQTRVLRHALVAIASSGDVPGGWSEERRQELWETMAGQCGLDSWQGWSHALCRTGVSLLPGLRGVALSGYDAHGAPHVLAVADEWTRQAEEIALLVGEGPGVEAHRTQQPVPVRDVTTEQTRWPGYVGSAADAGIRTVYAFPVQLDGVGLGSLTLYPRDQDAGGWPGWTDGLFLAGAAAKALLADLDAVEDGWTTGDFSDDRVQIATGMLAVRLDVSVDEASVRLRAFAFSNARGLGEVAQSVLDGTLQVG